MNQTCRMCGKVFDTTLVSKVFCSANCRSRSWGRKNGKRERLSVVPRFWSKVDKDGPTQPHMTTPCWLYTGSVDTSGYGQFHVRDHDEKAHRYSWALHNGPIPDGLQCLHACDETRCCRPDHLFLGTLTDNMNDKMAKGRGGHLKGTAVPTSKLTENDVRLIRKGASLGFGTSSMARAWGVSPANISAILHRKTWSHLP